LVVTITKEDGTVCLDTNTLSARVEVPDLAGPAHVHFGIDHLELGTGLYFVNVGVFEREWSHAYDYHRHAYPLRVEGPPAHVGILAPPSRWRLETPLRSAAPREGR
jgi:lipopolysaccharide transport system ATP-binding protein